MNIIKQLKTIIILSISLLWSVTNLICQNQYILNGDAYSTSCDCYTLTDAQNGQNGSVWNDSLIDLTNSFTLNFDIFLGCSDPGADGMVFALQPLGTNIGTAGGGMGLQGVAPSVGVYIDTYTNGANFDPFADHISVQTNGDVTHDGSPDDLTPALALPNMEDCNWHTMQISWDAGTFQFDVSVDGTNYASITNNFVTNIFSGNPLVYWGFTAATGGLNNQHSFCIQSDLDIEVSSDTLCVNESVTLIDSSEISGGVTSWQWDFGDGSPFETTPITNHAYSAPGTYTVELDLVDVSGCTYTVTTDIEVVEPATTSQTISSSCNACDGEIQLQVTSSVGPYEYSIDNGSSFQSSPNFDSICGDNAGQDYNVIVEDAHGCRDSIIVAVFDSVLQIDNVATVDSDCGANNGIVDVGTSSSGGSFPYLYSINGLTTAQALPINNIPPSNQGTYELVVTDSLNCTDTVQVTIDEINQPVLNNPQVTAASCFGVCDGSVILSGSNIAQYSIDGGQNYQSSGTFTGLCQGTYNVMVDNGFGCLDSLVFTVDEPAELEISSLPADVTLCAGETFTADATAINNIGLVNYTWEANGSNLGVGTPISFTTTGDMEICLTVSDDCPNTATECFNVIEPEPSTPAISSDVVSGCDPVTVNFENLTDGQIIETIWTFSDGTTITTNDASNVAHTFEGVGVYDVSIQVTTAEGCVFSQIWPSYIESFENPTASYTNNPNQASIFNTEVEFNSTSSNNVTQWFWDFSAEVEMSTSSEENPLVFYPEGIPATYPVQLVVSTVNGCRDTVSGQIDVVNDVILYAPNAFTPDNDQFNDGWRVWISGIDIFEFHLTLYNRWGEIVWESFDPEALWYGNYGSAGMVPDGTYIWKITAKDGNNDNIYDFQGSVTILR